MFKKQQQRRQSIVQFQDSLWFLLMCFLAPLNHWARSWMSTWEWENIHIIESSYASVLTLEWRDSSEDSKDTRHSNTQQAAFEPSRRDLALLWCCFVSCMCRFIPILWANFPSSFSLSSPTHCWGKSYFRQWCENLQILLLMNNKRRRDDAMMQRGWGKAMKLLPLEKFKMNLLSFEYLFRSNVDSKKHIYLSAQCNAKRGRGEKIS